MASQAVSGAASGAAAGSAFGPWGTAIGGTIGLVGGLMADSAERKRAKARAAALEAQAQRRLLQGNIEAQNAIGQGGMDQTTFASRALSSGAVDRTSLAAGNSLQEIANRAQYEADTALENAKYEADLIRQDASAIQADSKAQSTANYINAASSILDIYGKYSNRQNATASANQRSVNRSAGRSPALEGY